MQAVTFRATRQQIRGLAWFTSGSAAAAAALLAVDFGMVRAPAGRLLGLGVAAAVTSLIGGWSLVRYLRAFTECSPAGIRTRGLGRERRCTWQEVGDIAIRMYTGRGASTYTVILTTASGSRFTLGVPVSGGVMPDPEFDRKVGQIRAYWHSAAGIGAHAPGYAGPAPPMVVVAPAFPEWLTAGAVVRAGVTLVLLAALAAVPFALPAGGPALAVRFGQGQPGTYRAHAFTCTPACYWTGQFTARGGSRHLDGVMLAPGSSLATMDFPVPAVYAGDPAVVYPPGGGTAWIPLAVLLAVIAVCLALAAIWLLRRSRRRRRSTPWQAQDWQAPDWQAQDWQAQDWQAQEPHTGQQPRNIRREGGAGRVTGVVLLSGLLVVALAGGGATVAYAIQSVPAAPSPEALACADYGIWLESQAGTLGNDAAMLARARREAPPGPLKNDLRTLSVELSATTPPPTYDTDMGDFMIIKTQLRTVSYDCYLSAGQYPG